jgi:hypothetical protein
VQQILSQAATFQTQKTLDAAMHEQAMAKISHQQEELTKGAELAAHLREASKAEGDNEGTRLQAIYEALVEKVGLVTARQLLLLEVGTRAHQLVISPEMLMASTRDG